MMGAFFLKRLRQHLKHMLKYMRYVLNDHFIIMLLFLVGGLSFYYSQILETLPQNFAGARVIAVVVWVAIIHVGHLATLAEPADEVFILPKENQMKGYFVRSLFYSCIFPFLVIFFISGMTMPLLMVGAGQELSIFAFYLPMLWVLKVGHFFVQYYGMFQHDDQKNLTVYLCWFVSSLVIIAVGVFLFPWLGLLLAVLQAGGLYWFCWQKNVEILDWEHMIAAEKDRMHRIYQFINLFTDVPEISGTVKRRKYLDPILNKIESKQKNTYLFLYARRMLRGSELSGLYFRLVVVAGLLLYFLKDFWFSLGISLLFIYLIGFQLIPLYNQFNYMILTQLYPIPSQQKQAALEKLLGALLLFAAVLFGVIAFFALSMSLQGLAIMAALLVETFAFTKVYIPYRIKKME